MLVRHVMTRTVEEIESKTTLRDAATRMRSLDVGVLPVCDGKRLVGILTDRDIAIRAVAEGCNPNEARVGEAMTCGIHFCFDDDEISEAARIMEENQIRRLLVCDRENHAVGIISLGDIATRAQNDRLSGEILQGVCELAHPMAG